MEYKNMNKKHAAKVRAIGFNVARELTDQELKSVSGGVGDATWAMGPGGQCYASDVAK